MFEAFAEASNIKAVDKAHGYYLDNMRRICADGWVFELGQEHRKYKVKALNMFDKTPKTGGRDVGDGYRQILDDRIQTDYKRFYDSNYAKLW